MGAQQQLNAAHLLFVLKVCRCHLTMIQWANVSLDRKKYKKMKMMLRWLRMLGC